MDHRLLGGPKVKMPVEQVEVLGGEEGAHPGHPVQEGPRMGPDGEVILNGRESTGSGKVAPGPLQVSHDAPVSGAVRYLNHNV